MTEAMGVLQILRVGNINTNGYITIYTDSTAGESL